MSVSLKPHTHDAAERPAFLLRLLRPLALRIGLWNLAMLGLLLAILGSVASGIASVVRGLEFPLLWLVGLLAMLLGWQLGVARIKAWLAGIIAVLTGLVAVFVRVGRLEVLFWNVLRELGPYLVDGLGTVWADFTLRAPDWLGLTPVGRPAPDPGPLIQEWQRLGAGIFTLAYRAAEWLGAFFRAEPTYDPVAAALIWGVLLWLTAWWAGWWLRRQRDALGAVIPIGVLLGTVLSYAWGESFALVFLMGWSLALMAVVAHFMREQRWEAADIDYSRDIRAEVLGAAMAITIGLVLLALIVPNISVERIVNQVRERMQSRSADSGAAAEALGVEQRPRPSRAPELARASAGGLPRRHLLGTGPELRENVVMEVRTFELPPMQSLPPGTRAPTYYWRSLTYDIYNGQGWNTSPYAVVDYEPGAPSYIGQLPYHRTLRQHVRVLREVGNLVHSAGTLVAVDRPYQVAWRVAGDAFAATTRAETYRADSLVAMVSAEQLRESRGTYPPWILERYLTLPDTVPERVLTLARDLTATAPTPYDRAAAIETYLRSTYPYTLNVPLPAPGTDVVDYFLFTAQRGYCDYFASAMVVLARAAGLPARLAVGYVSGEYNPLEAVYIVTEADAHAWVEVYFTGYGWIMFEPTSGIPALERSSEPEPREWSAPVESLRPPPSPLQRAAQRWYWWGPALLLLTALGLLVASQVELLWLRLRAPDETITTLYHRLRRRAAALALEVPHSVTPAEFAARLSARLETLAVNRRGAAWVLPAALAELQLLCTLYVQVWYTPRPVTPEQQREALCAWRSLGWRLWLAWFWARQQRLLWRLLRGEGEISVTEAAPHPPMEQRF